MSQHGTFYWNELMTKDPEAAKAFYREVLGWDFHQMSMEDPGKPAEAGAPAYNVIMAGETPAGGVMNSEGTGFEHAPPQWFAYIAVDDVDAAVGKVESLGGKVVAPPFDVASVGRIAIIQDPIGATVGMITPVPRDG